MKRVMNSLNEFLKYIVENAQYFAKWKMELEDGWTTTSIRMDIFKRHYMHFCIKYGFVPLNIKEQTHILDKYRLKLIWRMDNQTQAYTNIRFKQKSENTKFTHENLEKTEQQECNNNSIRQFLEFE